MYSSAKIIVKGVVQGVGYRYFAYNEARKLGLTGYVRNLIDGSVESVVEGKKESILEYIKALRRGPAFAHVTFVDVEWDSFEGKYSTFRITY